MSSPGDEPKAPMEAIAVPMTKSDMKCSGGPCGEDVCAVGACCNQETCKCEGTCACRKSKCGAAAGGETACSKPADCTDGECPPPAQSGGKCKVGETTCSKPADCTDGECPQPATKAEGKCAAGETTCSKPADCTDREPCLPPAGSDSKCKDQAPCKGEDTGHCKEEAKDCPKKTCEGGGSEEHCHKDKPQDTSIVVWHPQTPPGHSPRSASPEDAEHKKACSEGGKKPCSPLPQGKDLKVVLFDIDGTIADSDPIHFLAFQEILVEAGYNGGVPITHEFFICQMSGKLNYVIAQELMPELEESKRVEMMDEKEVRYRKMAAKDLQPIPGFHTFVKYVKKRGLRPAAVTNSPRLNAEQVLLALKIPDFFEILVVGCECERPKPFPDPYLKAINFFGVEPKQCFVLEDSPSGVKAGVAAGAPAVGLLTGHPGPVLTESGACLLIKDYNDPALWAALGECPPCTQ